MELAGSRDTLMVIIEVTGARKKKAALARDAAIFAFNYLMPRAKKDVDVEIIFTKMNGVCGCLLYTSPSPRD